MGEKRRGEGERRDGGVRKDGTENGGRDKKQRSEEGWDRKGGRDVRKEVRKTE